MNIFICNILVSFCFKYMTFLIDVIIDITILPSILYLQRSIISTNREYLITMLVLSPWGILFILAESDYVNFIIWFRDWPLTATVYYPKPMCTKLTSRRTAVYFWNLLYSQSDNFGISRYNGLFFLIICFYFSFLIRHIFCATFFYIWFLMINRSYYLLCKWYVFPLICLKFWIHTSTNSHHTLWSLWYLFLLCAYWY